MSLRFTTAAALKLRNAIEEADGAEVFAVCNIVDKKVSDVTVLARGHHGAVPAILDLPSSGQAVVHNHPSGVLLPSEPDLNLASTYGQNGVGFIIVNNEVTKDRWVVEPWVLEAHPVDRDALTAMFHEALPRVLQGYEPRTQQVAMAHQVADALEHPRPLVVEAGTGTGKSLAYLVPAALWAQANGSKVIISTHTRALQAQLLNSDLPLLKKMGFDLKVAVLEGRGNYVCKRRLDVLMDTDEDQLEDDEVAARADLQAWASSVRVGSRSELPFAIPPSLWDKVHSDADLTLRTRCSHYDSCFFYSARRRAAAADLVIVNHALLMADLVLKADIGQGVLPKFDRIILDEAHHLEAVATGAATERVTHHAVRRALSPLLSSRRRKGALQRLVIMARASHNVPNDIAEQVAVLSSAAQDAAADARSSSERILGELTGHLDPGIRTLRITPDHLESDLWTQHLEPSLQHLSGCFDKAALALDAAADLLRERPLNEREVHALLTIDRSRKRLGVYAANVRHFLEPNDDGLCRWIEVREDRRRGPVAGIAFAPIEAAKTLQKILWDPFDGVVATSATLSVRRGFGFWKSRVGLWGDNPATEAVHDSPFDYARQASIMLPTDLPLPNDGDFLRASAQVLVEAVEASRGSAFVLCTSHRAVQAYGHALRAGLDGTFPVFIQGEQSRMTLLERFRDSGSGILVGTDSFWEGVSIKGRALRLVIIPRLPFRVPTDPLREARFELLERRGERPFFAYTLPDAILRLRQGFGRLIRHRGDRGAVLLLDRRLLEKRYGREILDALPACPRNTGPWRVLRAMLTEATRAHAKR
ncbi:MAG: helicase C-terminal domain-containing protein [Myxococcota bacterium]